MQTLLQWLLLPALVVGVAGMVRAQDSGEPRKTGKVLLLKTGVALEGDIEQFDKEICIRRGTSELRIAVDRTVRLCPDWIDAYAFMLAHVKGDNPNDHVRLARWCQANKLSDQAIHHAKAALELNPNHGDAKLLLTSLEHTPAVIVAKPNVAPKPAPLPAPRVVEAPPAVDVTAETFVAFTSKVQPILMNACAGCHAKESASTFRLERVVDINRKISTLRNLAAVLEQIDLDHPTISPLLAKAVTPHGRDAVAPLKDRNAAPFQSMLQWTLETIHKNPQLKEYRAVKNPSPIKKQPEQKPSTFSTQGTGLDVSRPVTPTAPPPQQAVRERDAFDPEIFNEWAHPRRGMESIAQGGPR